MSLATIETSMRGDVQAALDKAAETYQHARTILEEHLPAIAAEAARLEDDPIVAAAEAALLPPGARAIVADLITRLAAEFPAQPDAAPATAAGAG